MKKIKISKKNSKLEMFKNNKYETIIIRHQTNKQFKSNQKPESHKKKIRNYNKTFMKNKIQKQ